MLVFVTKYMVLLLTVLLVRFVMLSVATTITCIVNKSMLYDRMIRNHTQYVRRLRSRGGG